MDTKPFKKNNTGNYQSVSVPVYETIEKPIIAKPSTDVYAFTSSSNVKSFINQFGLTEGDVFAIGEKTAETL